MMWKVSKLTRAWAEVEMKAWRDLATLILTDHKPLGLPFQMLGLLMQQRSMQYSLQVRDMEADIYSG
jgi:hypothetical protein